MLLLIDCGESIFQRILERKLLDDVKEVNILITHLHSDHCGSLSSLILYCFYCKGIVPNVYFYESYKGEFLNDTGARRFKVWNPLNLSEFKDKYQLEIVDFKMPHVVDFTSAGYLIEDKNNNCSIFYTGDTNGNTDYKYYKMENIKVYHDCCLADYKGNVHTSLRKLCELIPKEYRHKVYCMHLDCDELIEKAKNEGFNVVEVE
jgi:ribonuclease BN (tRNA processing enzyme)